MTDLIEIEITDGDAQQVHSVRFINETDVSLLMTPEQANALALRIMQKVNGGDASNN